MIAKNLKNVFEIDTSKRNELRDLVKELSSEELQIDLWINGNDYPNASGIDEVFHFLFDDTDLGDDPESEIGRILRDVEEAMIIGKMCTILNDLHDRLGDADSKSYMDDCRWKELINIARIMDNYMNAQKMTFPS